jgi:phenylacetic acid degradation protein/carnitine operon protein CaiE
MNSVIMDRVELGDESIVGALSFIKEGTIIPPRSLVVGNPGKIIREVSDEMLSWKTRGTALYQTLPKEMQQYSEICEPLTELPADRPSQEILYETWQLSK